MTDEHDYKTLEPADDTNPTEYHYTERRAEILTIIEKAGSPRRIDTKQLAARYDVSRQSIYNDLDKLAEHVQQTLGKRAKFRTKALYEKTVDALIDDDEYQEAWKVTMEWNDWLEKRGELERVPDKHEIDADVTTRDAQTESASYRIVDSDATDVTDDATDETEEPPENALPDGEGDSGE